MDLATETKNDVLVVAPKEKRLDAKVAAEFKEKLLDMIKNHSATQFLIDLDNVDFVDSSGLGVMVSLLKAIGKNGELKIVNPKSQVKSMFELTRLNLVFNVFDDKEKAINSFS